MGWRIGVDTGGTFTDVCLYEDDLHRISIAKVASTPADPGVAVLNGLNAALAGEADGIASTGLEDISYFAHGTTVATNALLEGRGAKTGLVTTGGFEDLLELGRQRRPKLYDLSAQKPQPLVTRDLRIGVEERMRYDGSIEVPLDPDQVRAAALTLKAAGVEAVAVCFLHSYVSAEHENLVREILSETLPGVFISLSHEVLPEFREYERLSTVVINAFVGPVMQGYLSRLRERLGAHGLTTDPKVVQSNGGVMSFHSAERFPVRTALSGPSAGAVGAARTAAQSGILDIITFDMGGTSSDVALVRHGRPTSSTGMVLDGRPIRVPMLDINTVGAGGGSIAYVDNGGYLKVGPRSAGADPGPACYGKGNDEPTVTDANVVLGVLNQTHLLGGSMPIDAELSFRAVERLGRRLGMTVEETAQGIVSVVTANMGRAIRVISVQRGYDPMDYALVAFGGAGPLHSSRLAASLGMRRTIIPQRPGALSALGMLMTDLRSDYVRTALMPFVLGNAPAYRTIFEDLHNDATSWFEREGIDASRREYRWLVDARYVGQNYEIPVDAPAETPNDQWIHEVSQRFHDAHQLRYGHSSPGDAIEAVTFRVEAIGDVPRAQFPRLPLGPENPVDAVSGSRLTYLPEYGSRVECTVYDRMLLRPGMRITGPAIIEQYDTTALILPGEDVRVDEYLLITTELPR
jgi:N-methylhydantoinase A